MLNGQTPCTLGGVLGHLSASSRRRLSSSAMSAEVRHPDFDPEAMSMKRDAPSAKGNHMARETTILADW